MLDEFLHNLSDVLPDCGQLGSNALDLSFHVGVVQVLLDIFEFAIVIRFFQRSPPCYHYHLVDFFEVEQPIRNIDHDVAHADNSDASANFEGLLAERWQRIVVIDDILGMINAETLFALDTQFLGTLGAGRHDDGAEAHAFQLVESHRLILSDCNVTQIKNLRVGKDSLELFPQSCLHLFLVDKDTVLGQPARLDIAVEQDHTVTGFGKLARTIDSRRSRADHSH